jgi:hypothetical protein
MAPEFPADTTAWALPCLTRSKQTSIDASVLVRTTLDGVSAMVMTSEA